MGLVSLEEALSETRDEAGEMGVFAFAGGGGWCEVCVDVLCNREVWRDAHRLLGARTSRTGCCRPRGMLRANERVHDITGVIICFALVCSLTSERE
jgi:hypothetical protein